MDLHLLLELGRGILLIVQLINFIIERKKQKALRETVESNTKRLDVLESKIKSLKD